MYHFIAQFADWLQNLPWVLNMAGSTWSYPYVQLTHFTGLSLWVGTNIALDLHLLGIGKRTQTSAEFADALFVWNWIGFCIVVTGGFLLFSISASSYVANPAFQVKLSMLIPSALVWHIVVQRKARVWGKTMQNPPIAKFAGFVEMLLWFSVATAAVSIPYF